MYPVGETGVDFLHQPVVFSLPRFFEFLGHRRDESLGVNRSETFQQFLVGNPVRRQRRHFEQEVEVVGHDAKPPKACRWFG
jgi:hypothetical protein